MTNHTSRYFYALCETLKQILPDKPWDPLKPGIADVIGPVLEERGIKAAIDEYHDRRESSPNEYNFDMWELNFLGNRLIELDRLAEAIEVLKLNTSQFPESPRVFSELGDAFQLKGDIEQAAENYRKSLELDPDNRYAQRKLEEIGGSS